MSDVNPRYEVVRSSLKLMADGGYTGVISALGITEADWELLTGNRVWSSLDRNRVSALLQQLVFGSMDVASMPRIDIAAEYQAAVIVMFVSPNNIGMAAHWLSGATPTNETLAAGVESEVVTPQRLFALCLEAYNDRLTSYKERFESAIGKKLMHFERAAPVPVVEASAEPSRTRRGKKK